MVSEELKRRGVAEEWLAPVIQKVTGFGNKDGKETDNQITAQIVFVTQDEVKLAADYIQSIIENCKDMKAFEKVKAKDIQAQMGKEGIRPMTLDIALFGRMVTSDAFRNVEASLQMAHAISTNRLEREFDYYTAVDDLVPDDSGAGMISDTEYNSSCYYMYYNLDREQLIANLKGAEKVDELISKATKAFLRSFAYTSPSGKQNSFAAHQLPAIIYIEVKEDKIPVSYANAFLTPARPWGGKNLVVDSIEKLVAQINNTHECFNDIRVKKQIWFSAVDGIVGPKKAQCVPNMEELLKAYEEVLREE
jgi:CRISPR system Cascade subunit CasC